MLEAIKGIKVVSEMEKAIIRGKMILINAFHPLTISIGFKEHIKRCMTCW